MQAKGHGDALQMDMLASFPLVEFKIKQWTCFLTGALSSEGPRWQNSINLQYRHDFSGGKLCNTYQNSLKNVCSFIILWNPFRGKKYKPIQAEWGKRGESPTKTQSGPCASYSQANGQDL